GLSVRKARLQVSASQIHGEEAELLLRAHVGAQVILAGKLFSGLLEGGHLRRRRARKVKIVYQNRMKIDLVDVRIDRAIHRSCANIVWLARNLTFGQDGIQRVRDFIGQIPAHGQAAIEQRNFATKQGNELVVREPRQVVKDKRDQFGIFCN